MRLLVLGAGYIGALPPSRRWPPARTSCSPTTGPRPTAGSSTASSPRRARPHRRHPQPRPRVEELLAASGPTACCCSPRRPAGRSPSASPTARRRPTSPARGASPRRSRTPAAAGRVSPARCTCTARGWRARSGRSTLRRAGRPRAPLQDLRRAVPAHARAAPRLRRSRSCGSASSTGRARSSTPAPSRRPSSTSSAGWPPRGEPLTIDGGGRRRRSASCTSPTPRASCSTRRADGRRGANVVAETMTVADVAALAEGREPARRRRAGRFSTPFSTSTASRSTSARRSVRLLVTGATGLPRLAHRDAARASAGTTSSALARPGGRPRAASSDLRTRSRVDAGDPAARDLVAGCDAVLHFAGVPDPGERARATPRARCARTSARPSTCSRRCAAHGARLVYPSTDPRRRSSRRPTPTRLSKRLGEEACRLHRARGRRCG